MEVVRLQQEESLQQREQLVREMEVANQLTQRDQNEAEVQREALKLDLQEQVGFYSVIVIHLFSFFSLVEMNFIGLFSFFLFQKWFLFTTHIICC